MRSDFVSKCFEEVIMPPMENVNVKHGCKAYDENIIQRRI